MHFIKTRLLFTIVLTTLVTASTSLAQYCTPGSSSPVFSLFCTGTGNPASDKQNCLATATPSITLNDTAEIGGTLWPTLIQAECFLKQYPGPQPLVITSGTDSHGPAPSGRGHLEGFKIDLRITNQVNTFQDDLSLFIRQTGLPDGCRGDLSQPASPVNDHAPLWISTSGSSLGAIFAMEHPIPQSLNPCANPYTGVPPHWDFLSSYGGLTVTPTTLPIKVGEFAPVSPMATDINQTEIPTQAWMFDYIFPADPTQSIASIDATGVSTGTAGNVIGIGVGSSVLLVSEGPYFGFVDITVNPPDAPGGGPVCQGSDPTIWSACWAWDSSSDSWVWYPSQDQPGPPNPNTPPPPGQCPGNSALNVAAPGCWVWVPNGAGGAWVFVSAQGGGSSTATWPVTPVASVDPNDIFGLPGVGSARYLTNTSPFTYLIQFENQATATAPAQQVTVTNSLNTASFDLSTVALGPISFPGQVVTPPAVPLVTLGTFSTDVDLRPSNNLIVRVSVSLNSQSGVLSWGMTSLDPATMQPPSDPLAGFLPPGLDGSVSVTVNARSSLPSGTAVSDQASIVFDQNAAIATPVWTNTLDSSPPTSSVGTLPASESSANFLVSWQGTDTESGVKDFSIFVSDNGGPFSLWQQNTPSTSASFFGQWGHTYSFYSIARDLVGNVEAAKTAEATTEVIPDPIPPISTANALPLANAIGWNNTDVAVTLSSFDNPGGSGVKQVTYSATGAQTVASTIVTGSSATFTISTEGITTITFFATDNAGNFESVKTLTIQLDKTPPTVACSASPNVLWPPNNKLVPINVSVTVNDSLSGPAGFTLVSVTSNEPDSGQGDIQGFVSGTASTSGQLRAQRLGSGTGRVYTFTYSGSDKAGNTALCTTSVTVPHDQGQ